MASGTNRTFVPNPVPAHVYSSVDPVVMPSTTNSEMSTSDWTAYRKAALRGAFESTTSIEVRMSAPPRMLTNV